MPEEKKEAILARRLQNDSKCGGRSRTSIMSKGPQRWDNHDGDDDGGMKNKWYLSISLNLCFVVCFLQILYFLWGWIQIYFFCRLYTFGFNYTFYISCEVGLKHTFLDTGWALTEALADLIESVLTAASVLTKMRMGQDTLKMISENSLDLLYCNIYIVVEKRTLMLLQCSVRLNMQYVYFLAKDIEISIPSQSKDTWSTTKISHFTKDTFIYQGLKRPALFHHDAMIHIVLHTCIKLCASNIRTWIKHFWPTFSINSLAFMFVLALIYLVRQIHLPVLFHVSLSH